MIKGIDLLVPAKPVCEFAPCTLNCEGDRVGISRLEHVALPFLSRPAAWATLDTGHQIVVIAKPGEVVHLHTLVRTGSVNETNDNTGISHFLEHLLFKGSERFPAGAFDRILESIGARVNAGTSRDYTHYYVTVPRGAAGEYYRLALDLHADMLLHARLPEEEIGPPFAPDDPHVTGKRERMVVLEEIKMNRDRPWRRAVQQLAELLYPTHPYRREVLGTAQVIAGIPAAAIRSYYRTWYQPANMVTIITGELPEEETLSDVAHNFLFTDISSVPPQRWLPETPPHEPRSAQVTLPLHVAYVLLGFLGPPSADLRATVALDVISLLLGETASSRLHLRLVEQLPNTPFIDAGSSHWTFRDSGTLLAYGLVQHGEVETACNLLRDEVARLQREPPDSAEIAKAVTRLEVHFAAQAETAAGISFGIADSMARLNGPEGYTEYLPILHSLTPEDLTLYAGTYLPADRACTVIVAPE